MDALRYYVTPLVTTVGIAGFVMGGPWVWLGASTFLALMTLDIILPSDTAMRRIRFGFAADFPLYLQLPLMLGLYAAFISGVNQGRF